MADLIAPTESCAAVDHEHVPASFAARGRSRGRLGRLVRHGGHRPHPPAGAGGKPDELRRHHPSGPPVHLDQELVRGQVADGLPLPVDHARVHGDELGARLELRDLVLGARRHARRSAQKGGRRNAYLSVHTVLMQSPCMVGSAAPHYWAMTNWRLCANLDLFCAAPSPRWQCGFPSRSPSTGSSPRRYCPEVSTATRSKAWFAPRDHLEQEAPAMAVRCSGSPPDIAGPRGGSRSRPAVSRPRSPGHARKR